MFKKTIGNVFSIWVNRIFLILVALITTPIIINHFGLTVFGVWLLINQLAQHLMLLELGVNTSLTRLLTFQRVKADLIEGSRYLSASFYLLLIIGLLIISLAPLTAWGFQELYQFSSQIENDIYWTILIISVFTGVSMPMRTGIGMLNSAHHFDKVAFFETVVLVSRLILIVVFFHFFDPNLIMLAVITFFPLLVGNIFIFIEGRKVNNNLVIQFSSIKRRTIKKILSISGAAFGVTLSAILVFQSTPMLVGVIISTDKVAILAIPILIVTSIMPFMSVANLLIVPLASELDAKRKLDVLLMNYIVISKYVFSMGLLSLAGFYYLGHLFLDIWLGGPEIKDTQLTEMVYNTVIILSGFILAIPGFVMRSVLIAVDSHWKASGSEILGSVVGVTVGVVLMLFTSLDVIVMAIGIFLTFVIRGLVLLLIHGSHYFSISYFRLVFLCMFQPISVFILIILLLELLDIWLPIDIGISLNALMQFLVFFTVWSIYVWIKVIKQRHKYQLLALVRSYLVRIG
jgi:O-antigen/teichoic acid export membrane protein